MPAGSSSSTAMSDRPGEIEIDRDFRRPRDRARREVQAAERRRAPGSIRTGFQMPTVGRSGPQSQPQPNCALRISVRRERLIRSVKTGQDGSGAPATFAAVGVEADGEIVRAGRVPGQVEAPAAEHVVGAADRHAVQMDVGKGVETFEHQHGIAADLDPRMPPPFAVAHPGRGCLVPPGIGDRRAGPPRSARDRCRRAHRRGSSPLAPRRRREARLRRAQNPYPPGTDEFAHDSSPFNSGARADGRRTPPRSHHKNIRIRRCRHPRSRQRRERAPWDQPPRRRPGLGPVATDALKPNARKRAMRAFTAGKSSTCTGALDSWSMRPVRARVITSAPVTK